MGFYGPPTSGGGGAGVVNQIATAVETDEVSTSLTIPTDGTIPQITEGEELISLAFTPTSATAKLLIEFTSFFNSDGTNNIVAAIFQNGVSDALNYEMLTSNGAANCWAFALRVVVDASSVTARTFSVRYGGDGGTTYCLNQYNSSPGRRGGSAVLTVTEFEP